MLVFVALEHIEIFQRVHVHTEDKVNVVTKSGMSFSHKNALISESEIIESFHRSIDSTTRCISDGTSNSTILDAVRLGATSHTSSTDKDEMNDNHSVADETDIPNTVPGVTASMQMHIISNKQLGFYLYFGFICLLTPVLVTGVLTYAAMPYGIYCNIFHGSETSASSDTFCVRAANPHTDSSCAPCPNYYLGFMDSKLLHCLSCPYEP